MSIERKQGVRETGTEAETLDPLYLCGYLSERSPLPLIAVEGLTHLVRYVNPAFCRLAGSFYVLSQIETSQIVSYEPT